MPGPKFINHTVFNTTIDAAKASSAEQVKIERAIGRALLSHISGNGSDLLAAYAAVGGSDPIAKQMFAKMNPEIAKIQVAQVQAVASATANAKATAASKSGSVVAGNPLFKVDNTALKTLATLGGKPFAQTYKIPAR